MSPGRRNSILPLFRRDPGRSGEGDGRAGKSRVSRTMKNHFVAFVGEFIGTVMFLFLAFSGTQVANVKSTNNNTSTTSSNGETGAIAPPSTGSDPSQLLYIALTFGFSLTVNVWIFYRISGGLFNPAVTLALYLAGAFSWFRAVSIFLAQLLAGMVAAAIVSALFPGPLNVSTTLSEDTNTAQGLFIEAFLTFELVFTIFMLAVEKHRATFLAPIGIGLALFVAELSGVFFTGGSLNPTRSFGPCVVTKNFPPQHWIYWLGPFMGSVAATGLYKAIKDLDYNKANPGQDAPDKEAAEAAILNADRDEIGCATQ